MVRAKQRCCLFSEKREVLLLAEDVGLVLPSDLNGNTGSSRLLSLLAFRLGLPHQLSWIAGLWVCGRKCTHVHTSRCCRLCGEPRLRQRHILFTHSPISEGRWSTRTASHLGDCGQCCENVHVQRLHGDPVFNPFRHIYTVVELLSLMAPLFLISQGSSMLFSVVAAPRYSPPSRAPNSTSPPALVTFYFLILDRSHRAGCEAMCHCGFISISLISGEPVFPLVEHSSCSLTSTFSHKCL